MLLHPIISEILNQKILTCFFNKYSINSTNKILEILNTNKFNNNVLVVIVVDSHFMNVPVKETIDTVIQNVYKNYSPSPLNIRLTVTYKPLLSCITQVYF